MSLFLEPQTALQLRETADGARAFLLGPAAQMWSRGGQLLNGLFPERFELSGIENTEYFRTFVQARHVFSFASIGHLGWDGPWPELVAGAIETLLTSAKRPDGFFVHKMDRNAVPLDERADLYDQAFMLLALAVSGSSLERPEFFDEAENLLTRIRERWSHPQGGYREGEIADATVRRQNPHMHLLEAFLALSEASNRPVFAAAAQEIAELARNSFIDPPSGALLEYFSEDFQPAGGVAGRIAEPGHCFEWAWLFERFAAAGSPEWIEVSDRLTEFGRKFGLDHDRGVAVNEVLADGQLHDGGARLWPQTERIKAAAIRFRRLRSEAEAQEAVLATRGLEKYCDVRMPGLWRDKLNLDGSWLEELAPGSSLYHISCAYAELMSL
jgi:mannose/cellobiose epimerase-like protein (N-acyl-D-glucosamine 2-epimerase family)